MSEPQSRAEQDPYAEQRKNTALKSAVQASVQSQQQKVSKTKHNPKFYREIADLNVPGEQHDWVENELGAKAAPGHILGNRDEDFVHQQQLLNQNEADRIITEGRRGRLLVKNPVVDAVFQGLGGAPCVSWDSETGQLRLTPTEHPDYVAPMEQSPERRQVRSAMELQTARESLQHDQAGLDALTKATTEHVNHNEQAEEETKAGRLAGVLGR